MNSEKDSNIEKINKLIKDDPQNYILFTDRGVLKSAEGDKQGAIDDFSTAININPKYAKAYFTRANAYKSLGNNHEALADLNQSILLNPSNFKSYAARAKVKLSLGDNSGAEADNNLAKILNTKSGNANVLSNSGDNDNEVPFSTNRGQIINYADDEKKETPRIPPPSSIKKPAKKDSLQTNGKENGKSNTLWMGILIGVVSIVIIAVAWKLLSPTNALVGEKSNPASEKRDSTSNQSDKSSPLPPFKVTEEGIPGNKPQNISMVFVEGGTFNMGDIEGMQDEKPIHKVKVSSFYISKSEVTVREYREYCNATGKKMPSEPEYGWKDNDPIVNVTWYDAKDYCNWSGFRLPTEAEWEFAARGGNSSRGFKYSGSNSLNDISWNQSNSGNKIHSTAEKSPNELGLFDMTGNVWEWCSDWYSENYYGVSETRDPQGPSSGNERILRGSSYGGVPYYCRVAKRYKKSPDTRFAAFGFRVVKNN